MIREICFNPVIDKMYFIENFIEGNIYRKLSSEEYAGGKGINIAKALTTYGIPNCCYVTVAGKNGKTITDYLEQSQIEYVSFDVEGNTRTTINIIDTKSGRETELLEIGSYINEQLQQKMLDIIAEDTEEGDIIICSGIGSNGMEKGIYRKIAEICQKQKALCVLDANDDWLEEAFPAKYYLMKPNIRELKELFDIKEMITERQLFSLICKLREKGVRNVLLSNGKEGALYFGENEIYKISIPSMKTISTIGSGDCTVAGFCAGINLGLNLEEVLKFSMAWGISNTQHSEGGCIEKTEVDEIKEKVAVRRCSVTELDTTEKKF